MDEEGEEVGERRHAHRADERLQREQQVALAGEQRLREQQLRAEVEGAQREPAEPRRRAVPRGRDARGGLQAERELDGEHAHQVGVQDEEELLEELHEDREPVGRVCAHAGKGW